MSSVLPLILTGTNQIPEHCRFMCRVLSRRYPSRSVSPSSGAMMHRALIVSDTRPTNINIQQKTIEMNNLKEDDNYLSNLKFGDELVLHHARNPFVLGFLSNTARVSEY